MLMMSQLLGKSLTSRSDGMRSRILVQDMGTIQMQQKLGSSPRMDSVQKQQPPFGTQESISPMMDNHILVQPLVMRPM